MFSGKFCVTDDLELDVLSVVVANQGALARLMRNKALHAVFQPLGDLHKATVFAHEALIRGPAGSPFQSPDTLLAMAANENLLVEFELFCITTALSQWGACNEPGRLFVNISADTLVQVITHRSAEFLSNLAQRYGIAPRLLVFEITEHERVVDMSALCEVVKTVRASGAMLALDDFGDGRSSLRLWSEIRPDFVKIDKYFIHNISRSTENLQMVHAIKGIASVFRTQLIAEGIETAEDLRVVRDLGLPCGQGYLLGRPHREPQAEIHALALSVMQNNKVAVMPQPRATGRPAVLHNIIVVYAPSVDLNTTNDTLHALFNGYADLHAVAVVDDGRPVALVNRQHFMNRYATLYFREVNGRKPCTVLANHEPRIVELDYDVDELVGILTSQDQRYLTDGFIVTDNGRYVGLGTADQLVRSVTESRIEAARHANPLTFLPGNIPISLHIDRLLKSGTEFVACYADLNNFKPFNDYYGYWRGDEMIRVVAKLAVAHCDACVDFVGHVGGDDFLMLFQSADWRQRCEQIVADFALQALALFDEPARQAGGIHAEDRHGVMRFFPCTTLSIGAAPVQPGEFFHSEEVANEAALAKHDAKLAGAGLFVRPRLLATASAD